MRIVSLGLTVGLLATSLGFGCSNSTDVSNESEVILEAEKLEAPPTIAPATTLSVLLTLDVEGCVSFDRVAVQRAASEIRLTAFGIHHGGVNVPCAYPPPLVETVEIAAPFPAKFTIVAVQPASVEPLTTSVAVQ